VSHWTPLTVDLAARARRDVKSLDAAVRARVLRAVHHYAATGQGDVKRLQASEEYRLRVGDWRVRFAVVAGQIHVMHVLRIAHRREAYRR
jgi:mRNA interferase RelE/StbE